MQEESAAEDVKLSRGSYPNRPIGYLSLTRSLDFVVK